MELLSEKINIVRWILGLTNDASIIRVSESIKKLRAEIDAPTELSNYTISYTDLKDSTFDLEQ